MGWKKAYPSDQAKRTKLAKDKIVPLMEQHFKTKIPTKDVLSAAAAANNPDELITLIEKKFKLAKKKDMTSVLKGCGF